MKTFGLFAAFAAAAAFSPAFADVYGDFASYDAGGDNAWFFELSTLAQKKGSAAQVRENLARAMSSNSVSDAAFRDACLILKPIADSDTIPALAPRASKIRRACRRRAMCSWGSVPAVSTPSNPRWNPFPTTIAGRP